MLDRYQKEHKIDIKNENSDLNLNTWEVIANSQSRSPKISTLHEETDTAGNSHNIEHLDIHEIEKEFKFEYFDYIFEVLFTIKNKDDKIKKISFEIKGCLLKLGYSLEALNVMNSLYQRYQEDYLIVFECLKSNLVVRNLT